MLVDGHLDTRWAAVKGPPRSAWVEIDLGATQLVNGVVLVTDQPDGIDGPLVILAEDAHGGSRRVVRVVANGAAPAWRNAAPRIRPSPALTARFGPVEAQRLRLVATGPVERLSIAELFVLGPPSATATAAEPAAPERQAQELEASGNVFGALQLYREAMRRAPDAPEGYEGVARLAAGLRESGESASQQVARFIRLGLLDEARATYEEVARLAGPDQANAELARARARVAEASGDASAAARLDAEAASVVSPARPVSVRFGRAIELMGYDMAPGPARAGETLEVTTHWRLRAQPDPALMVWLHFRGHNRALFADDFPTPRAVSGLVSGPQHVSVRRRIAIPPDADPGQYRLVAGVWDPISATRLHVWWRGLLPTFSYAVTIGTVDVVGPAS
jgi:hypothetical protein